MITGDHILHRAHEFVEIEFAVGLRMDKDQPHFLMHRQSDQAAIFQQSVESVTARHPDQIAMRIERPGMIGAREGMAMAATFGQLHPAMAAGIEERARLAILAASQQDRLARQFGGVIVTVLGNVRGVGDHLRAVVEELFLFLQETFLVGEAADIRFPSRLVPVFGFVPVDHFQQLLRDRDALRTFHGILSSGRHDSYGACLYAPSISPSCGAVNSLDPK